MGRPLGPALVIPAAGASSRLGECKALVDLGGRTPLELLLEAGAALAPPPPLVLAGADLEALRAALPPGAELLHNPRWSEGRSGGLALAAAARPGLDLFIAPVDTPLVPAEVFSALLEVWESAGRPARGWLSPRHQGRHGHPLLLGRDLARELAGWPPARSLRELRRRAEPIWALETPCTAVLDDLDEPADLEALRRRIRGG